MQETIAELDHVSVLTVDPIRRGRERWIVNDVSLSISAHGCTALLGPNGCGKSTLARVILGQIWPSRGRVRLLGQTLGEVDLASLRQHVQLVQAQAIHLPGESMTATDVVLTGLFGTIDLHASTTGAQKTRAAQLLTQFGIGTLAEARYLTMSTGERMRTLIARALIASPSLIILDEPTAGLDLVARESLVDQIETMSTSPDAPAVLLITHHVEELPRATKQVILMRDGAIVQIGTMLECLNSRSLQRTFDREIAVASENGRYIAHLK